MEDHPDLLYKGSNQVISALLHFNDRFAKRTEDESTFFWRNYPVLVFNGSIFYATLTDKGKMKIEETNYVHYYQLTTRRWYLIDIVRIDFLEEYLKHVNAEFERTSSILDTVRYAK